MFGGGEVWMLRTLKALAERHHQVFLLCRPHTELANRAQNQGIHVITLKVRGDFGPLTILRTALILKRNKIQVLLTNMDKELRFAGCAAKIAGHCVVIPRRGIDYPLKNKMHYRFSYVKLADCVIANSIATKKTLLRNAPWLPAQKVHVIYNGIDPEPFFSTRHSHVRKDASIPGNGKIVGFVGQLDERKGIRCLLQAFQKAVKKVNAYLLLSGTGPLQESIIKFASETDLSERIALIGFCDHIEKVMSAIDVLVLPSLWEGFGIVLIEAMAAGKPVITTAVSSMPEIVLDGITGRVVAVNDTDQLAGAIIEILSDKKKMLLWGKNGRQRVLDHFTLVKMVDQLEELFHQQIVIKENNDVVK
jgi:glycosyltransferase involved in cell wall biosynthesis